MAAPTLLGKAELLGWAAEVTKITPCEKYGDLRDGLIFLALTRELFPREVDSAIVRLQRRGARDPSKNWSLLTSCLRRHGIPVHLCNRQAVERGHTRHCFNLLVLFYFLLRLARGEQFSVDFAQPVDPQLAAFLQSPASVAVAGDGSVDNAEAVRKGRKEGEEEGEKNDDDERQRHWVDNGDGEQVRRDPQRELVVTRLSSPPSAAVLGGHPVPVSKENGVVSPLPVREPARQQDRVRSVELSPVGTNSTAAASPSLAWQPSRNNSQCPSASNSVSPRLQNGYDHFLSARRDHTHDWDLPLHRELAARRHTRDNPASGAAAATSGISASSAPAPLAALETENRLLREELAYVKAVAQLCLTQQRGAEAAAEMRAAATLRDELAKAQLTHLHDLRQLEVSLTAAPPSLAPTSFSMYHDNRDRAGREAEVAAVTHRADVAEQTAAQLYAQLHENAEVYDATLRQLQQVFHSLTTITEAAQPVTASSTAEKGGTRASPYYSAAAYEAAVAEAMLAQLTGLPVVLKDAFRAQLQALLVTVQTLRVSNERLRAENDKSANEGGSLQLDNRIHAGALRHLHDSRSSHALTTPLDPQDLASLCDEAHILCQRADPSAQQICHRLTDVVETLCGELQVARHEADDWRQRSEQMETIAASAEAALQRARTTHAAAHLNDRSEPSGRGQAPQRHVTPAFVSSPPSLDRVEAEDALREAQRLYERVAEVLVAAFSSPGSADMKNASHELASLLVRFMEQQQQQQQQRQEQPHEQNRASSKQVSVDTAMERALAEQCDTIAQLRREVRQGGATAEQLRDALAASERRREELTQHCAALETQLRFLEGLGRQGTDQGADVDVQPRIQHAQRGWLGPAPPSSSSAASSPATFAPLPVAPSLSTARTPQAKAHLSLPHQKTGTDTLHNSSTDHNTAAATPLRLVSSPRIISPYRAGALRSPSPSTSSEDEGDVVGVGHKDHSHRDASHRRSRSAGNSLSSTPHRTGGVQRCGHGSSTSQASPSHHTDADAVPLQNKPPSPSVSKFLAPQSSPSGGKVGGAATAGAAAPSPLLSAAELERRKQEILRRFNVE